MPITRRCSAAGLAGAAAAGLAASVGLAGGGAAGAVVAAGCAAGAAGLGASVGLGAAGAVVGAAGAGAWGAQAVSSETPASNPARRRNSRRASVVRGVR